MLPQKNKHVANQRCVVEHLSSIQRIIERMERNSNNCKMMCVIIIAAIMISIPCFPGHSLIAFVPVFVFGILDSYYLALGRSLVRKYNEFVKQIQSNEIDFTQIYNIQTLSEGENLFKLLLDASKSISIFPVYFALGFIVFLMFALS